MDASSTSRKEVSSVNVKLLQALVWAARLRSFSAAAARLNISQPTVSLRMQELEKLIGVPLFERRGRSIRLTPRGREALSYAERICQLYEDMQAWLGDPAAMTGHVQLGITETIALTWLPALISELNRQFPNVVFEMNVGLTEQVWKRLEAGDLEIALLAGPNSLPNVRSLPLGCVSYEWVASPKLVSPEEKCISPARMARWPVISLSQESVLFTLIDDWFLSDGAEIPKRKSATASQPWRI